MWWQSALVCGVVGIGLGIVMGILLVSYLFKEGR